MYRSPESHIMQPNMQINMQTGAPNAAYQQAALQFPAVGQTYPIACFHFTLPLVELTQCCVPTVFSFLGDQPCACVSHDGFCSCHCYFRSPSFQGSSNCCACQYTHACEWHISSMLSLSLHQKLSSLNETTGMRSGILLYPRQRAWNGSAD